MKDSASTRGGPSAGPLPSRPAIPSGDRPMYSSDEGQSSSIQTGAKLRLYGCRTCGRVSQLVRPGPADAPLQCPRCATPLNHRLPASLQRTWAYLIAATVLYIPANLLPIMSTASVFEGETKHTIIGGIEELRSSGDWLLAVIVFIASIAVPLLKIGALLLLAEASRGLVDVPFEIADFIGQLVLSLGQLLF